LHARTGPPTFDVAPTEPAIKGLDRTSEAIDLSESTDLL